MEEEEEGSDSPVWCSVFNGRCALEDQVKASTHPTNNCIASMSIVQLCYCIQYPIVKS